VFCDSSVLEKNWKAWSLNSRLSDAILLELCSSDLGFMAMCPKIHDLFGHLQTTGYFEYDHKIRRQFSQTSFFNMFFNIPVDLRGRTSFFASSELPFHPPIGEGKTEEVSVEDALKDKKAKKMPWWP